MPPVFPYILSPAPLKLWAIRGAGAAFAVRIVAFHRLLLVVVVASMLQIIFISLSVEAWPSCPIVGAARGFTASLKRGHRSLSGPSIKFLVCLSLRKHARYWTFSECFFATAKHTESVARTQCSAHAHRCATPFAKKTPS